MQEVIVTPIELGETLAAIYRNYGLLVAVVPKELTCLDAAGGKGERYVVSRYVVYWIVASAR